MRIDVTSKTIVKTIAMIKAIKVSKDVKSVYTGFLYRAVGVII